MAPCSLCRAETQLYVNGTPICLRCCDERDRKNEQTDSENLFPGPKKVRVTSTES
jgi:hypothetical protein